jgi:SAM-dependent methyltransferase
VEEDHRASAEIVRSRIARGQHDARAFRAALLRVPTASRDAWLDAVLGLDELPDDSPALPRGCVPYFPCSVDVLLRTVDQAGVGPSDVFVDIGSGPGRAAALVHLLTGASVVGIEIQPQLVLAARELSARVRTPCVAFLEGDAASLTGTVTGGSVYFLYCPFSGHRLASVLADIEAIARTRALRVCCVDLPLPPCPWLTRDPQGAGDLAVYRSRLLGAAPEPRRPPPA